MTLTNHAFGTQVEAPDFTAFFGNRQANLENLKLAFPQFSFIRIRQVHGDEVIETTNKSADLGLTGDAQWTTEKNMALCISTADCAPVMLYSKKINCIAAIHAGWRGVANRIVPKSLELFFQRGAGTDLQVLIGPHIQMESFEVENAIRNQISSSLAKNLQNEPTFYRDLSSGKSLVDLHNILKSQLAEFSIPTENISAEMIDTKKDLRYHSYRRDKEASGRQLSFIVMK